MLRTIYLKGALAHDTGVHSLKLDVHTPRLLLCGLKALVPGFERSLRSLTVPIHIISGRGDKPRGYEKQTLDAPFGDDDTIFIAPAVEGAGFEIVAYFAGVAVADLTIGEIVVGIVLSIAISAAVGAIATALAGKPNTGNGSARPNQKASFIFNGPLNVVGQGVPVPLTYGTCLTGSVGISADEDTVDIA